MNGTSSSSGLYCSVYCQSGIRRRSGVIGAWRLQTVARDCDYQRGDCSSRMAECVGSRTSPKEQPKQALTVVSCSTLQNRRHWLAGWPVQGLAHTPARRARCMCIPLCPPSLICARGRRLVASTRFHGLAAREDKPAIFHLRPPNNTLADSARSLLSSSPWVNLFALSYLVRFTPCASGKHYG